MEKTLAEQIKAAKDAAKKRIDAEPCPSLEVRTLLNKIADGLFDPKFSATKLRRKCKPSKITEKEFKAQTGFTIGRYIKEQRMLTRRQLLETTNLGVCEVAALIPGVSENHISSNFRKWDEEHRTPTQVRPSSDPVVLSLDDYRRLWFCTHACIATPEQSQRMRKLTKDTGTPVNRDDHLVLIKSSLACLEGALERHGVTRIKDWCRGREFAADYCHSFFEALSERSRTEGRKSRQRGCELAELALALVEGNAERLGDAKGELMALAWARLGNARRLVGDHQGAQEALRQGERWIDEADDEASGSVKAEVFYYWGSLRLFERRFQEAERYLREALIESRAVGHVPLEVGVLQQRAALHTYGGEPKAALSDLRVALQLTPPDDIRRRLISTQHLLVIHVILEDYEEMIRILPEAWHLVAQIDEKPGWLQIQWAEGLLCRQRGDFEEAEDRLKEAHQGFGELGDIGMKAVASLDLALLHEARGCTAQALEYASEALPALEALNLPEALGAFQLLRSALLERRIGCSVLKKAMRCLLTI